MGMSRRSDYFKENNLLLYLAEVALERNPSACIRIKNPRNTKIKNEHYTSRNDEAKSDNKYKKKEAIKSLMEDAEYENQPIQISDANKESIKPEYHCHVSGCKKIYTSKTGFHYHKTHGHKNKEKVHKPYKCEFESCDKTYKNANGLVYHYRVVHGA